MAGRRQRKDGRFAVSLGSPEARRDAPPTATHGPPSCQPCRRREPEIPSPRSTRRRSCVDLDAFERNLDLMANAVARRRGWHCGRTPSRTSARRSRDAQIARGAVGICCQKVDEAEAFVAAGIRDVLVTNEIVGAGQARAPRGARAAARPSACSSTTPATSRRICRGGDGGRHDARRAGRDRRRRASLRRARPARRRRALAAAIARAPGPALARPPRLSRRGAAPAHAGRAARRDRARRRALAAASKAAIEAAGLACPVVTGAGTGTWQLERDSGVYTELQPGSYVFMDADYGRNALAPDQHALRAEPVRAGDGDERAGARRARSSTRD